MKDKYLVFFLELVTYVHDVSPVKKARRSGVEYFNFKLQTEKNVIHDGVSFNVNIKDPLDEARLPFKSRQ